MIASSGMRPVIPDPGAGTAFLKASMMGVATRWCWAAMHAAADALPQDRSASPVIAGRAMLIGGWEFACEARKVTVRSAEIQADPAAGIQAQAGQAVVCYLDEIGLLPGKVLRPLETGFLMGFLLPEARWRRIASRLEWHSHRAARSAELRSAPRIVPLHREVEVRLGEGIVLAGRILNISMSGAAITLDGVSMPFVGARVRIGARYAVVVRLLDDGIGVQFDAPFTPENFDERVRP